MLSGSARKKRARRCTLALQTRRKHPPAHSTSPGTSNPRGDALANIRRDSGDITAQSLTSLITVVEETKQAWVSAEHSGETIHHRARRLLVTSRSCGGAVVGAARMRKCFTSHDSCFCTSRNQNNAGLFVNSGLAILQACCSQTFSKG